MALLDPKKRSKRVPISIWFEEQLIDEINVYCKLLVLLDFISPFPHSCDLF